MNHNQLLKLNYYLGHQESLTNYHNKDLYFLDHLDIGNYAFEYNYWEDKYYMDYNYFL